MPSGGATGGQGRSEIAPAGPGLQEPGHPQEFEVAHQGLDPLPGREEIDPGGLGQGHEPGRLVGDPMGKLPPAGLGEEMAKGSSPGPGRRTRSRAKRSKLRCSRKLGPDSMAFE